MLACQVSLQRCLFACSPCCRLEEYVFGLDRTAGQRGLLQKGFGFRVSGKCATPPLPPPPPSVDAPGVRNPAPSTRPCPCTRLVCLTGGRSQSQAAAAGYEGRGAQLKRSIRVTCKNPEPVPSTLIVLLVSRDSSFGLDMVRLVQNSKPS